MNSKRLLKLASLLEKKPEGKFSLKDWRKDNSCGTTACAVGWAASDKNFRRAGLRAVEVGSGIDHTRYVIEFKDKAGQVHYNFTAAAEFFDISIGDSLFLFSPDKYEQGRSGRRDVIRRIRKFVKDHA